MADGGRRMATAIQHQHGWGPSSYRQELLHGTEVRSICVDLPDIVPLVGDEHRRLLNTGLLGISRAFMRCCLASTPTDLPR